MNLSNFYRAIRKNKFLFFCFILNSTICAEPKYPVDVSYLVSDFKYSQEHGLKICEVQQGALSAVNGDLYVFGGDGSISPMIADYFSLFPMKKWAAGVLYPPLKRSLVAKDWDVQQSMSTLLKDPDFLKCATLCPIDPFSISSYGGIVYAGLDIARHIDFYRKAYPGILFIDAATFPYWKDKYKMSALFEQNDELRQYKADWRLYPKKYDPSLAEKIYREMPSELYVIKPRGECLANGVIVVANADLDDVLQMILEPSPNLEKHPDKKYAFWGKNREDTFLIEKYYASDYLSYGPECHYDATLRLAFILQYNEGKMTYHCLGGFWKLPSKALEEEGTLNEQRISRCAPPFYRAIDRELLKEVNAQMERAMLLLYEAMLIMN